MKNTLDILASSLVNFSLLVAILCVPLMTTLTAV